MNIQEYFNRKKDIQSCILTFLEREDHIEENYQEIINRFKDQKIEEDRYEIKFVLTLIARISNHHYRSKTFISKVEKIISFFEKEIKKKLTNIEIFSIFKSNKRILLFLLENNYMYIDQNIFDIMSEYKYYKSCYLLYFFPELKSFLKKTLITQTKDIFKYETPFNYKETILNFYRKLPENFEEKRKIGENEHFISEMIRTDNIDEFIGYVNQKEYPLQSMIKESIYETNLLLINQSPTLIEYAAFFGSIQIFKYLYLNGVELTSSLWIYAIHGDNPEIINILEEKNIEPYDDSIENDDRNDNDDDYENDDEDISYNKIYEESIKCHHNDIVKYIQNNFINEKMEEYEIENNFSKNIIAYCLNYYNFQFLPCELKNHFIFHYFCKFGYFKLVMFYIKTMNIDINKTVVFIETLFYSYDLIINISLIEF